VTDNRKEKRLARELMKQEGIPYTVALRRIREQKKEEPPK
jgi:hypothetical protein